MAHATGAEYKAGTKNRRDPSGHLVRRQRNKALAIEPQGKAQTFPTFGG